MSFLLFLFYFFFRSYRSFFFFFFFFFIDTATTEIYTLSLHDALPICGGRRSPDSALRTPPRSPTPCRSPPPSSTPAPDPGSGDDHRHRPAPSAASSCTAFKERRISQPQHQHAELHPTRGRPAGASRSSGVGPGHDASAAA